MLLDKIWISYYYATKYCLTLLFQLQDDDVTRVIIRVTNML